MLEASGFNEIIVQLFPAMETTTHPIDQVLDHIRRLPCASRRILVEILQKRIVQEERDRIATAAKRVEQEYTAGNPARAVLVT